MYGKEFLEHVENDKPEYYEIPDGFNDTIKRWKSGIDNQGERRLVAEFLIRGFVWADQPEGHTYWNDVYRKLHESIEE